MGKIVATEFMTLDGVMEAPGGEDSLGALGGWSFLFWNDEAMKFKFDELFASDALLLGRKTYEIFAAAWPSITDETGFADQMNSLPKYVVSTTLKAAEWNPSSLINTHVAETVSRLKQQHGQDILICGSADLVNTLMEHDLIDEYRIMLFPIVLGKGKRLFSDGNHKTLKLTDTKTLSSGVAILTYQPAR